MRKCVKVLLLALGLGLVLVLFWRADPGAVWAMLTGLGGWAPLLLLPYGFVYLVDTLGWRFAFGREMPRRLTFWRLFRIRWAGESVNAVVPTGYVGGEAVKVYLLHRAGVSGWRATTSVVVSKTVQTLAQVLFIAFGALLGAMHLPANSPFRGAFFAITGCAFLVLLLLLGAQGYGFFRLIQKLTTVSRRARAWFAEHATRIAEVDQGIRSFYHTQPKWFALSTGAYFIGWLGDTLEIWLMSKVLGWPLEWGQAAAMEAFIGVAKAVGTFVPASVGVQESGVVLLFRAFGLTSSHALAYALFRRGREVVYALAGLGFLWSQESSLKLLKVKTKMDATSSR
jgi:uncharacterized protein (TIRG00374 family)